MSKSPQPFHSSNSGSLVHVYAFTNKVKEVPAIAVCYAVYYLLLSSLVLILHLKSSLKLSVAVDAQAVQKL